MAGETNLQVLLSSMQPVFNSGEYVFISVADGTVPSGIKPVVTVAEAEGLTIVAERSEADTAGLHYEYVAGWITLRVHSALEAVGLTAAVAAALAGAGISCNVVAGYHHDHLFVPHERAAEAVAVLADVTASAAAP